MPVHVSVTDDEVDIRFEGADRWLAMSKGVRLPMEHVTGARVTTAKEAHAGRGWRNYGSGFPGWVAAGWFQDKARKGYRQLWAVYRDPEVLVIDTDLERPSRVVVQHPDRHDLAWWIGERVGARG